MNILLVHGGLQLGGIETLIVRLCERLHALGHRVTLLTGGGRDPELERRLTGRATIREMRLRHALRPLGAVDTGDAEVIFTFGAHSLLLATWIRTRVRRGRVVAGVYHDREYVFPPQSPPFFARTAARILAGMPDENIVFMSAAVRAEHAKGLSRPFARAPIVPLAIEPAAICPARPPVDRRKLVSVGRLVDFKTYNFTMLDVLAELDRHGHVFEYHVYGDGPQAGRLRAEIARRGLGSRVYLHGSVPHSAFGAAVGDAFAFVGQGTAALEAAAAGVPTIIAVEGESEPVGLGLLHDVRGGDLGERESTSPRVPIAESILRLARADGAEYRRLGEASWAATAAFSADAVVAALLKAFDGASPEHRPRLGRVGFWRATVELNLWALGHAAGLAAFRTTRYARPERLRRSALGAEGHD